MLALLSAVCYAVYVILLKVKIEDEERVDMQLFFGWVLTPHAAVEGWRLGKVRGAVQHAFPAPFYTDSACTRHRDVPVAAQEGRMDHLWYQHGHHAQLGLSLRVEHVEDYPARWVLSFPGVKSRLIGCVVVTIGLSLTIPFAMAGDLFRGASATITWQSLVGAALVIAG
jgi:solute carrier family 35 protein F5